MDWWNKTFLKISRFEWLIVFITLLVLARLFFAQGLAGFDIRLIESIGLEGKEKYLITAPLAIWVLYSLIRREHSDAAADGTNSVATPLLIIAISLLMLLVGVFVLALIR